MPGRWTDDDHFRFDIALGLMKARVRGMRRLFSEEERERIARAIVEHLRLSRWNWWREERSVGPGYMARMPSRTDTEFACARRTSSYRAIVSDRSLAGSSVNRRRNGVYTDGRGGS
jgi:hypothetical protein